MRLISLLVCLLALGACATHPGKVDPVRYASDARPVLATTEAGTVRGVEGAGVRAFLGVPFAQPPVGVLRWRAPQPVPAWDGVRDARRLGSDCTQAIGRRAILGGGGGIVVGSEDCLYLNIYAPAGADEAKPVMVYIPGGAFTIGAGANYDPSLLAREQGRVVVTLNYRLGALGWLAHPGFQADGEGYGGNFGLMDQQAALKWVHRNIAAFGGDPGNVTLFAESAGAWSACYLMTSPGSEGLFQRVIMQSGGCLEPSSLVSAEATARAGPEFARSLGCEDGPGQAACLKGLPAWRVQRAPSVREGLNGHGSWGPVHTDATVPENPAVAFHQGRFTRVPVIIGTNRDEGRLFANEVKDVDRYQKETIWMYGDVGERVLARYPVGPDGPAYAIAEHFTDQRFACPSQALRRQLARYVPVWGYEFADRDAPFVLPKRIVGLDLGAYHASELAYVFGTSWIFADVKRFTPEQKALSARMRGLWAGFGQKDFGPDWPRVEGAGPVRVFQPQGDRLDDNFFERRHCDFWDGTPFGAVH